MATPAQFAGPPAQPPEVTNQFGPYGAAAAAVRERLTGGKPGGAGDVADTAAANPQGAMMAQANAINKVLDQMTKISPPFAPFAKRIAEIMQAGLEASLQSAPGGTPTGRTPPPPGGTEGGGAGAAFPG